MDNRKIILAFYIVVSAIVWFYSRTLIDYVYFNFYKVRQFQGIEYAKDVVPVAMSLVAFIVLLKHRLINQWADEVVAELKKVTWPAREDVVRSTTVVVVCILVASFILAGFDVVWGKLIGFLLSTS